MCAPEFFQLKNENEPEVEEARVHSDILEVLNNILRIIMENQEEASDSEEEDENAAVVAQAPVRSASGSLDGAPPNKRPREDSSQ